VQQALGCLDAEHTSTQSRFEQFATHQRQAYDWFY
jgi:hypothetical protein